MKKFAIRLLTVALALTLVFASLTACGPNTDKDGNVIVTMTIMDNEYETPGWLAMIEAANGVLEREGKKVRIKAEKIVTSSWDEYYTKVTANISGRVGGTIGRIAESHIPDMVALGQTADLTALVNELKQTGDFNNAWFDGVGLKNNKYYTLPSGAQNMVLYYNKTLFDAYNAGKPAEEKIAYPSGDWTNASTFAEIRETASKLTQGTGNNKRFGISAGPYLSYIGMYAMNSGGENIFADGIQDAAHCVINSQPFIDAYNWLYDMLNVDRSMPLPEDTARADSVGRFLSGNTAMLIDGVWQMYPICEYTEDFEIGVAAIPVLNDTYDSYTTSFSDCFWASSTSWTPAEDKIALKALMSKEATEAAAKMLVGGFPVRPDCEEAYLDALRETKLAEDVDVIANAAQRRITVPYSTYYNKADQIINQKLSLWINGDPNWGTEAFVAFADETMKDGIAGRL